MTTSQLEDRLRSYARLITRNFNLNLHFVDGITPSITTDEMFIPALQPTEKAFRRAKFFVAHEAAHDLFSELTLKAEAIRESLTLGHILNALEDARIEHRLIRQFEGLEEDFSVNVKELLAEMEVEKLSDGEQALHGLYLRGRGFSTERFSQTANQHLDELANEIQQATAAKNSREVLAVSKRVYKKLAHLFDKTDRQSKADARKENESQVRSGTKARFTSIPERIQQEVTEVHAIEPNMEWDRCHACIDGVLPESDTLRTVPSGSITDYLELIAQPPHVLVAQIRQLMEKRRAYKRRRAYLHRQKAGVVDSRRLWKIATDETAIFKQRRRLNSRTLDVDPTSLVFSVLLDISGSMVGSRITCAKSAMAHLGEVLHQLSIPFAITAYTVDGKLLRYLVKTFDEPYTAVRTRLVNLTARSGTFTSEQIPFGLRQLQGRKERKKALLVVTDVDGIESEYRLNRAMAQVKAEGIFLLGVGIQTNRMGNYFDRYVELDDPSDLSAALLRLLRDVLR